MKSVYSHHRHRARCRARSPSPRAEEAPGTCPYVISRSFNRGASSRPTTRRTLVRPVASRLVATRRRDAVAHGSTRARRARGSTRRSPPLVLDPRDAAVARLAAHPRQRADRLAVDREVDEEVVQAVRAGRRRERVAGGQAARLRVEEPRASLSPARVELDVGRDPPRRAELDPQRPVATLPLERRRQLARARQAVGVGVEREGEGRDLDRRPEIAAGERAPELARDRAGRVLGRAGRAARERGR